MGSRGESTSKPAGKARMASTERSRLCRQRQKAFAQNLENTVHALRASVQSLEIERSLHLERLLTEDTARAHALAKLVCDYCALFKHGMAVDRPHRSGEHDDRLQRLAERQGEFMIGIMDPDVEVFDWVGRSAVGSRNLVDAWFAWSAWHDALSYDICSIDIVTMTDSTTISMNGTLRVRVSHATIANLFPQATKDHALVARLLGAEIQYPIRGTFIFTEQGRVCKYIQDMDFVAGLLGLLGDLSTVMMLIDPHEGISLDDRAVGPYSGCSVADEVEDREMRDVRLNVSYLLS